MVWGSLLTGRYLSVATWNLGADLVRILLRIAAFCLAILLKPFRINSC